LRSLVTRILQICLTIFLVTVCSLPIAPVKALSSPSRIGDKYVLVGGQSGSWFRPRQNPKLYKIFLSNYSVTQLTPVQSEGTVWTGGWNGSQWLISGWGTVPGPRGSDPYIYLYDGETQIVAGSLNQFESESSWHLLRSISNHSSSL
jgi:hypothetical protein